MVEALHLGTVGLAAVGACCTAAARTRGKTLDVTVSLIMLTAMIDAVAGFHLLPAVGWSLAMLTAVMASGLAQHLRRSSRDSPERQGMRVHRNIGAILMAAQLICMDAMPHTSPASEHGMHGVADPLGILLGVGSAAYTAASLWQALRHQTTRPPGRIESAAMGLSVLIMAVIAL